MKKDFFYLLCAFSLAGCLEATTTEGEAEKLGEIWGYVCDIDSREGISNALVELSPSNISCRTDPKGFYGFNDLASGNYKITVQSDRYDGLYRQVKIEPGREFVCDFFYGKRLIPMPRSLRLKGLTSVAGKMCLP